MVRGARGQMQICTIKKSLGGFLRSTLQCHGVDTLVVKTEVIFLNAHRRTVNFVMLMVARSKVSLHVDLAEVLFRGTVSQQIVGICKHLCGNVGRSGPMAVGDELPVVAVVLHTVPPHALSAISLEMIKVQKLPRECSS